MAEQFSEPDDVLMFRKYYSLFLQIYRERGSNDCLACILLQGWDLSLHLVSNELQKCEKSGTYQQGTSSAVSAFLRSICSWSFMFGVELFHCNPKLYDSTGAQIEKCEVPADFMLVFN